MNVFYYAPEGSIQALAGFDYFSSLSPPLGIQRLPSGLAFSSDEALQLRSGDIIVLFVLDEKCLEALLRLKNECSHFKIIMIFQSIDMNLIEACQPLSPKFCTSANRKYFHAEETIRKIIKNSTYRGLE